MDANLLGWWIMEKIRLGLMALVVMLCGPAQADSLDKADALARYEGLQQRIASACESNPGGDLCQVYLHGLLQGVQATGLQAERLAGGWASLYEEAGRRHPVAWLARDILHASSCTPDALGFLSSFSSAAGDNVALRANEHVQAHCQPVWMQHRLEAPRSPGYIITQR